MDVARLLTQLKTERQDLDEAIVVMERLARGRDKRRGRPPAWLATITDTAIDARPTVGRRGAASGNARARSIPQALNSPQE